ncbi:MULTISPECIES: PilC/PilY family type IV pilus protein [unclassified Acinetobacter]|uniref:PilC/PilY family type IV pilus protein n=1 Tax=unclassified Acinetobacter TaxID=196816 RepID=UPI0015D28F59|nr:MULTISPECIES: PilC/PilY family type IV pilus protein [unclassified Acinetobacter]
MKSFDKKILSAMVSMSMTLAISHSANVYASDIEIYSNSTPGKLNLFLMLDTSGSMGYGRGYGGGNSATDTSSIFQDYGICTYNNYSDYGLRKDVSSESLSYQVNGKVKSYTVNYCHISKSQYNNLRNTWNPYDRTFVATGDELRRRISNECDKQADNSYKCYDRISRLKKALVNVLTSDKILDTVSLGVGQYSTPTTTSWNSHDSRSGRIIYPTVELSPENREKILEKIVELNVYNGTPSASAYAEAGAYMLGKNTYGMTYSGYTYSHPESRDGNNGYKSPLFGIDTSSRCNGQGIYFLTDGFANNSVSDYTEALMRKSFSSLTESGLSGGTSSAGWSLIGKFAKQLYKDKNIKTAVVGFGSLFPNGTTYIKNLKENEDDENTKPYYDCSLLPEGDLRNTCNWGAKKHKDLPNSVGGYGNGGFYSAQSEQDIINSIVQFVEDTTPKFESIATGSPTIPVDALNPIELQDYGYYASFLPKPQDSTKIWTGNLNKYDVFNGQLGKKIDASKIIPLIKADGKLDSSVQGLWTGGVEAKIPLGTSINSTSKRTVFTNRQIDSNKQAISSQTLTQVNLETLFDADDTKAKFKNDEQKNYWLNVLGYKVDVNSTLTLANLPNEERRKLGSVMHSKPILLTQSGEIDPTQTSITTSNREDYLLFGTTQGALHVVDDNGVEKFTFIPHEMMNKQKEAFLDDSASKKDNTNDIFYGIDGQWAAFTQYVTDENGKFTVKKIKRTLDDKEIEYSGLQWVYGGLRMGGRSYYALDLSDIDKPTLKFHIDPDAAVKEDKTDDPNNALAYMGESWSKPTVGYINWEGKKTLVMVVGGGYHRGYENPEYNADDIGVKKGAGVYIFNANDGSLLWWGGVNATKTKGSEAYTTNSDMKYSIVSQVNAIDRDSDGLLDNLYVGDLGGQVFRIDINNNALNKNNTVHRISKLYGFSEADKIKPRFYEMPSFSVEKGVDGLYGVIAAVSGDRSSPLAGTTGKNANTKKTAEDGVFVIFDNDVGRMDLMKNINNLRTPSNKQLLNLDLKAGVAQKNGDSYNLGWKYTFGGENGRYKGMNELYAMDSYLFTNVYDRDGVGVSGSACGGGVKGDTYLYQFCLPSGKCNFYKSGITEPNKVKLGAGILGAGLGKGYLNNNDEVGVIVPRPDETDCLKTPNAPECQLFKTNVNLKQLRWYEVR